MLDAAMRILPSADTFTEIEFTMNNRPSLVVTLPKPQPDQPDQFWSEQLHKDLNCLVKISAQETQLEIHGRQTYVVLATVTIADTKTEARLGHWLVVSDPVDCSQWMNSYFNPSRNLRELAEDISSHQLRMERVSA